MKNELLITCPKCDSDDVSKPKYSAQAFAIAILLIGFPLPFLSRTFHCFDCGCDFKKKDIINKIKKDSS
jgi:predicted Zn-ribbon and HTH transcriptional regulator